MSNDNFDKYTNDYNETLNDSLAHIGGGAEYFAKYKVNCIKEHLEKYCVNKEIDTILDYGCGIGNNLKFLREDFSDSTLYGIDISKESINISEKLNLNNCHLSTFDGDEIPYENNNFDIIFISNVLHHINYCDHDKTIKNVTSKLKDTGNIFIFEHNPYNPFTIHYFNNCSLDTEAKMLKSSYTKKLLSTNGYKHISTKYIVFIPPKLKYITFVDKYLKWLPLGAQYYISAVTEKHNY